MEKEAEEAMMDCSASLTAGATGSVGEGQGTEGVMEGRGVVDWHKWVMRLSFRPFKLLNFFPLQ